MSRRPATGWPAFFRSSKRRIPVSEATHIITQTIIVPAVSRFEAGCEVSQEQLKGAWDYLEQHGFVKSIAEIEAEADEEDAGGGTGGQGSGDDTNGSEVVVTIEQVKTLLAQQKLQKATIAEQLNVSPDAVAPLLTAENGIEHAGGWYSVAVTE